MTFNKQFLNLIYSTRSLEDKLKLSEYWGGLNSIFDMGLYEASVLESHLAECVARDSAISSQSLVNASKKNTLHIISEPYLTGGHTRLCERLSSMEKVVPDLLITRSKVQNLAAEQRIVGYFGKSYKFNSNDSMLQRIVGYIAILSNYRKLVMHIHQDDICIVVTIALIKKYHSIKVFFVNHADHCFCFGDSIVDVKLQISSRGYLVDKLRGNANYVSSFIGIPVAIPEQAPIYQHDCKIFVMAGFSWKMKPNKYGSSPKIVEHILKNKPDSSFIIIGPNLTTDYWWWKLYFKYKKRLSIHRALPYEQYLDAIRTADACVDTCPVIGGTAFVEMALQGLKPFGVSSGIGGYTPLDIVKSKAVDKVLLQPEIVGLYDKIVCFHSEDHVKSRLLSALSGQCSDFPGEFDVNLNNLMLFNKMKKVPMTLSFLILLKSVNFSLALKLIKISAIYFSKISFIILALKLPWSIAVKISKASSRRGT